MNMLINRIERKFRRYLFMCSMSKPQRYMFRLYESMLKQGKSFITRGVANTCRGTGKTYIMCKLALYYDLPLIVNDEQQKRFMSVVMEDILKGREPIDTNRIFTLKDLKGGRFKQYKMHTFILDLFPNEFKEVNDLLLNLIRDEDFQLVGWID